MTVKVKVTIIDQREGETRSNPGSERYMKILYDDLICVQT